MKTISLYFFVVALSVGTHSWTMKEIENQVVDKTFVMSCVKKTLIGMPNIIVFSSPLPVFMSFFEKTFEKNNLYSELDTVELPDEELKFLKKKRDSLLDEVKRTKGKRALKGYSTMFADCIDGEAPLIYSIFRSGERSLADFSGLFLPKTKDAADTVVRCVRGKMLLWYNEYFFDPLTRQKRKDLFNTYRFSDYLKDKVFGPYLGKPICEVEKQFKDMYELFLKKEMSRIIDKLFLVNEIAALSLVNQLAPNLELDQDEKTLKKVSK